MSTEPPASRKFSPDPYDYYANISPFSLEDLGYELAQSTEVKREIQRLFTRYGTDVAYGKYSTAPCSAWRSERIQISDESLPRFANRLHIFEGKRESRRGRYLGFLSLRPKVQSVQNVQVDRPAFRYTAIAHITPPRFMLRPRYHIITSVTGVAEGIMPFRGVPFCVPNIDTGNNSACLHAAIHEALLLKMNSFACTTINSQDMLSLLWQQDATDLPHLYKEGANLQQALQVLQHKDVRSGGILETIPHQRKDIQGRLNTIQCMTDYLANGLPLILAQELPPQEEGKPNYHSSFVFGMHLLHDPEEKPSMGLDRGQKLSEVEMALLPGRFVYHDILEGPFMERSAASLLDRAWMEDERNVAASGISFLAVAPWGAKMKVSTVRSATHQLIRSAPPNLRSLFLTPNGIGPPPAPQNCRIVIRLLQTEQLIRRYLLEQISEQEAQPLQNVLPLLLGPDRTHQEYWWCAEVRPSKLIKNTANHFPALVYIWPIESTAPNTPHAMIQRMTDTEALFISTKGEQKSYVFAGQSA